MLKIMSASAKNRAPWLVLLQKVLTFAARNGFPKSVGRQPWQRCRGIASGCQGTG